MAAIFFRGHPYIWRTTVRHDKPNIFQVKKDYGVVTVQDAGMKTVVSASTAKTNQSMVEVERKNRPVLNVNARIYGQIVKVRNVDTIVAYLNLYMINIMLNFFVVTPVAIYIFTGSTYQSQPHKISKEVMEDV